MSRSEDYQLTGKKKSFIKKSVMGRRKKNSRAKLGGEKKEGVSVLRIGKRKFIVQRLGESGGGREKVRLLGGEEKKHHSPPVGKGRKRTGLSQKNPPFDITGKQWREMTEETPGHWGIKSGTSVTGREYMGIGGNKKQKAHM